MMSTPISNNLRSKQCLFAVPIAALVFLGVQSLVFAGVPLSDKRHITLEGQSNFRDIGGYKTNDGRVVQWGLIFRSGELHSLSDKDVVQLDELGIVSNVNFLSDNEIKARGKDRLPPGVNEFFLPISGEAENDLARVVMEARRTADFSTVPVELNAEIHRILVGDAAREQYASLLRLAADPSNHPLVFHCSHGVHRTGTATAILLSALGVPWETVREDYLLSNTYRKEEVVRRTGELRDMAASKQGVPSGRVDMTNINAFYILEGSYIDASMNEINKKYGSMAAYLREGLGLSDEEINKLQRVLLH